MPGGLTAIRLLLAGVCVATLGIAYSMARPSAEAAREVGSPPVRVVGEATPEVPGLGRAAKLPALKPRPHRPPAAPAPVAQPQAASSVPVDRPRRRAQPSVAPPAVAPSPPVSTPAPAPPPPTPVYEAPPPQPPPSTPQPDPVTFDDSG